MEQLHHELWIVQAINAVFGPVVVWLGGLVGYHFENTAKPIPDYIAMVYLILVALIVLAFVLRSRLSVENPGSLQVIFEDIIGALGAMKSGAPGGAAKCFT